MKTADWYCYVCHIPTLCIECRTVYNTVVVSYPCVMDVELSFETKQQASDIPES
jgi:hypothetical protein